MDFFSRILDTIHLKFAASVYNSLGHPTSVLSRILYEIEGGLEFYRKEPDFLWEWIFCNGLRNVGAGFFPNNANDLIHLISNF